MKLFIATPHYRNIEPEHFTSVMNSLSALKSTGLGVEILHMETNMVPLARTDLCELALEYGADKILFIDSDIKFSPVDIGLLLDANKPIVGGLYVSRYYPMRHHVYKLSTAGNYAETEIKNELFECDGIGAGFLMIDKDVIAKMLNPDTVKNLGRPFNLWQRNDGVQLGEDFSFCFRAKELGYKIWCEPNVNLAHVGVKEYVKLDYAISKGMYYCNEIQGWMSLQELNWLYQTAKKMESVIELGSWKGRSTHALASGCRGSVIAIDHFKGSEEETAGPHKEAASGDSVWNEFMDNVGFKFNNVQTWRTSTDEAAQRIIDKKITADMIFIDASHDYESVKKDIEMFMPFAKKIICGHDFKWTGVNRAVEETIGLDKIELHDTIWAYRIK